MTNQTNDWGSRLSIGARKAAKEEAKGMGSIARYVRDEVMPYIGMRMQEGALAWRADSDEAVKAVIDDLLEAANVASVKGMEKNGKEFMDVRNVQGYIRRAVLLYRATTLLTAKHEHAVDWTGTSDPQFPLAWFKPEDAEIVQAKGVATHAPFSGRTKLAFMVVQEGEIKRITCTISETAIVGLTKTKLSREQDDQPEDATPVVQAGNLLSKLLDQAEEMKQPAITGDAADAFADVIQRIVRNPHLWQLVQSEREAFVEEQKTSKAA